MGIVRRRFFKQYFTEIWLLLLGTMAITITILSLFLYKSFEASTIRTIHKLNRESLYETERMNEYVRRMIRTSGMELFSEPSVRNLLYGEDLGNFEALLGIRRIDSVRSMERYIHSIYVYNARENYVYATSDMTSSNLETFADRGILDLIDRAKLPSGLIPLARFVQTGGKSVPVHSFAFHSTSAFAPDPGSVLVINITLEWLSEILQGDLSSFLMIDEAGRVLYHDDLKYFLSDLSSEPYVKRILSSGEESGAFTASVAGTYSLVLHAGKGGLYFVRIFPYQTVMADLRSLQRTTLRGVLFVLLFGVLITFLLSRRLYKPIKRIVLVFKSSGLNEEPGRDEIGNLSRALESIVTKTASLEEFQRTQSRVLQKEVLKEFLQGEMLGFSDAKTLFREYGLPLKAEEPFKLAGMQYSPRNEGLAETAVKTLEKSFPEGRVCLLQIEEILLIIMQEKGVGMEEPLVSRLEDIDRGIIALSGEIPEADSIPRVFPVLREMVKFGFLSKRGSIMLLENGKKRDLSFEYPVEIEKQLLAQVRAGDTAGAETVLINFIKSASAFKYDLFRFSIRRLYVSLRALLREVGGGEIEQPGKETPLDSLPAEPSSLQELADPFVTLIREICFAIESNRRARHEELSGEVERLIRENYSDANLSMQGIADSLGFSVSHISRVFKEVRGLSVADAITDVRLKAAKRFLLEGDSPAKEIAQRVGFFNENYFYTLFRKKVGLSPAEFRKTLSQGKIKL